MKQADYDRMYKSGAWSGLAYYGPQHRHCTEITVNLVRDLRPSSFADVGCGDGATLRAIGDALGIDKLAGFDISPSAIEEARRRLPSAVFEVCDFIADPPPGMWDVVLCSQVVEHIPDDLAFLAALRSITARYCIVETMQGRMRQSETLIGHIRNYSRVELESKMMEVGLQPVRVIEWGWPFYSPMYRSAQEWFGGNDITFTYGRRDRAIATLLYQLYRLNRSTKGDVLMVVGEAV